MAQWLAEGGGNYSVAQRVIGRLFVALTSERLTCGRNGRKRTGQSCFYDCYECMMFYEPGYTNTNGCTMAGSRLRGRDMFA